MSGFSRRYAQDCGPKLWHCCVFLLLRQVAIGLPACVPVPAEKHGKMCGLSLCDSNHCFRTLYL